MHYSTHIKTALNVATRAFDSATQAEQDAILSACAEVYDGPEGEAAARALHHRREARAHEQQLLLKLRTQSA